MMRGAVTGSVASTVAATVALDEHLAAPLSFGILGVVLARIVFVDRENRRRRKRQSIRETVPLTLVACLIEFGLVVYFDLNLPKAIFCGLGTGWTVIAILDVIGERLLRAIEEPKHETRRNPSLISEPIPEDQEELLRLVDRVDKGSGHDGQGTE